MPLCLQLHKASKTDLYFFNVFSPQHTSLVNKFKCSKHLAAAPKSVRWWRAEDLFHKGCFLLEPHSDGITGSPCGRWVKPGLQPMLVERGDFMNPVVMLGLKCVIVPRTSITGLSDWYTVIYSFRPHMFVSGLNINRKTNHNKPQYMVRHLMALLSALTLIGGRELVPRGSAR